MSYDTYDSYESRGNFSTLLLIGVVLLSGILIFIVSKFVGGGGGDSREPAVSAVQEDIEQVSVPAEDLLVPAKPEQPDETIPETTDEILGTLGVGLTSADPSFLIEQIGRNLEAGEVRAAAKIIGRQAVSAQQIERLNQLAMDAKLKLNMERPVSEIGELEIHKRARWALNIDDEWASRIYFDLVRGDKGWGVQKMTLPAPPESGEAPKAVLVDALGITDAFLQAALKQNFETAKSFVNGADVSDAKIAGLCIVFEEGSYNLRPKTPLRAVFNRNDTAAFLANVETPDGAEAAQFGINVQRDGADAPWRVTEINLDQLLADYAERVAGGDVYFTPLVRNPRGGDTLILYFGFDEDIMSPRTERQLEIVSLLLQTDSKKTLTLSGHTDAIGSEAYNKSLSGRRAEAVRTFLIDSGVNSEQIKTVALGKSSPRRPNTTEEGEDNPDGRRANRRTEIYLDF